MKCADKYKPMYFPAPAGYNKWIEKDHIEQPPVWCSVDLRDGNQALIIPMSLEEKIEFFKLLVEIGFKEIEVGFPAASETEYEFCRTLIEQNLIPDDVTIQVLTQAREHIIKKTFEAVKGAPHAIIHVYNSTSVAQREQVFRKDKEQIKQIAIDGATLLKKLAEETEGNFTFQYSPESFQGTEVDYALDVCNAVLDIWQPTADNKAIINLPTTVENAMPHVFASQVEYFNKHLPQMRLLRSLCKGLQDGRRHYQDPQPRRMHPLRDVHESLPHGRHSVQVRAGGPIKYRNNKGVKP